MKKMRKMDKTQDSLRQDKEFAQSAHTVLGIAVEPGHTEDKQIFQLPHEPTTNESSQQTESFNTSRIHSTRSRLSALSTVNKVLASVTALFAVGLIFAANSVSDKPTVELQNSLAASAVNISPAGFCPEASDTQRTKDIWAQFKIDQANQFDNPAGEGYYFGYTVPTYTYGIIEQAIACQDRVLLGEIAGMYLRASGSLLDAQYNGVTRKYWWNASNGEVYTSSQQWFYSMTRILAGISVVPQSERTTSMNTFVSTYRSVISGYYKCWVWVGCREDKIDNIALATLVNQMYDNVGNTTQTRWSVDDRHQWPIAAIPNLYMAYKNDPSLVDLSGNNYPITEAQIVQFIRDSARLIQQRSVPKNTTNIQGETVVGYTFDEMFASAWRAGVNDFQYSGYEGYCFPVTEPGEQAAASTLASVLSQRQVTNCPTVGYIVPVPLDPNTATDFSHAWRLVPMYLSLYAVKDQVSSVFPSYEDMQKVANHMAYTTSNKDLTTPRFKNYWSGSNGWYRINYGGKAGFGFGPWQNGTSYLTQGLSQMAGFNNDLVTMTRRMRDIMNSSNPADIATRDTMYSIKWVDGYTPLRIPFNNPNDKHWMFFLTSVPPPKFVAPDINSTAQTPIPPPVLPVLPPPTPTPSVAIPSLVTGCTRYEAEDMSLGGTTITTYNAGFSGSGYVENFGAVGNYVEKTIQVSTTGTYKLTFRYGAGNGDATRDVTVDGVMLTTTTLPGTVATSTIPSAWAAWAVQSSAEFSLSSGTRIIRVSTPGGSFANLDYLDVCLVSAASPIVPPAPTPTPSPTPTPTPPPVTPPVTPPSPPPTPTVVTPTVQTTLPVGTPLINNAPYDVAVRSLSLNVAVAGTITGLTATINGTVTPIVGSQLTLPAFNGNYTVLIKDNTKTWFNQTIRIRHPDFNRDGRVDTTDLNLLNSRLGRRWRSSYRIYDLNLNGKLDAQDTTILLNSWGM